MPRLARRHLPWLLAALALAAAGDVWIARAALADQREAFDTDARIAHRLLSQRVVQHDAILATLALLQPGRGEADGPEQRLPSLYPQVLQVLRRDAGQAWPDARLQAAETQSRTLQRAVLAALDLASGRYWLVRAAEPSSYALRIDVQQLVPWAEWPLPAGSPVRLGLELDGQRHWLQAGNGGDTAWHFDFGKHLAAESQPFDMVARRALGGRDLPWWAMAAWTLFAAIGVAAMASWQRQRTERRRAEELLRLGQVGRLNALGELAAGMAHELNQPLTALLASTQAARRLLDDDPPELATARDAMRQAAEQARRAADVVGRLRRAVERPDRLGDTRPVDLHDAVRNVMHLLDPECRRRHVDVAWQLPSAAVVVKADPVALEQVVHNLVMNALQALDQVPAEERRLNLTLIRDGSTGLLHVADNGPGIAPELLARVFEPFFSTRDGGMGLGLSLCETLATAMGGTLTAHHHAPRGAEFRLVLPLAPQTTA